MFLAPAACAQTASGFGGFYVGAHGGYGFIDSTGDEDVDGVLGGFHAGYNYVSGAILLGVEGDYDWSDISFSESGSSFSTEINANYYASIRGRLGLVHASTLVYATAGYSWSELEGKISISGLGSATESFDLSGAVVGFGIEYKLSNAFSVRLEGLEYWGEDTELGDETEVNTNVVRAGASYYFK